MRPASASSPTCAPTPRTWPRRPWSRRAIHRREVRQEYCPEAPRVQARKVKGAQEAHEAIRPTPWPEPAKLKKYWPRTLKLYTLIWQRMVASQMAEALFDTMTVDIAAQGAHENYLFRISGATLRFSGFLAVYEEARDEDAVPDEDAEAQSLPLLSVDDLLTLVRLLPEQQFTQAAPRFTEASLVKALEEYGIGRPSTYAPIISTIQQRGYVVHEDNGWRQDRNRPCGQRSAGVPLPRDCRPEFHGQHGGRAGPDRRW